MKIIQEELINDLISRTKKIIGQIQKIEKSEMSLLNLKSSPEKWSILECLEHLNLYGNFYLTEIEQQILKSKSQAAKYFQSGLLGNFFAKSMLPKNGKINKMKTFKDKDPSGSELSVTTLHRFLKQQQRMLELLEKAKTVNLNKVKTSITIPVIKLKLGDTFRFVIYHNQRHVLQIENIKEEHLKKSQ